MTNNIKCSFCSNQATTVEHIIPKWLQRHYNLYDKTLRVWTGKLINYRCATIPACQPCNGVRLANLENRIRTGKASERDYYLWALKIRYGLSIMDARLLVNPKDPEEGFLLPPEMVQYKTEFILPALASLDNPTFQFDPDPFGSVFLLEQEEGNGQHFGFADVPPPYWAFSIVLPPNKILAVLLADRGVVKSFCKKNEITKELVETAKHQDSDIPRLILFFLVKTQNQIKIPSTFTISDSSIVSEFIPNRLPARIPKLRWYIELCNHLQISEELGRIAFENDFKAAKVGYFEWRK